MGLKEQTRERREWDGIGRRLVGKERGENRGGGYNLQTRGGNHHGIIMNVESDGNGHGHGHGYEVSDPKIALVRPTRDL